MSNDDSALLLAIELERGDNQNYAALFVDNTPQIVCQYEDPPTTMSLNILGPGENDSYVLDTSTGQPEVFKDGTTCEDVLTTTLPLTPIIDNHESLAVETSPENSSLVNKSVSGLLLDKSSLTDPAQTDIELPVPKAEQILLIHAYLQETGTWCEATDSSRHFTVTHIHPLMNNRPFAAAAMALAS